jgi:hypothetical protein
VDDLILPRRQMIHEKRESKEDEKNERESYTTIPDPNVLN